MPITLAQMTTGWQNKTDKNLFYQGYQFWNQTDRDGKFAIKNIRAGNYSIYAWVPGFIGDYKSASNVVITPGELLNIIAGSCNKLSISLY